MDKLILRAGQVFFNGTPAGLLHETAEGFSFAYLSEYVTSRRQAIAYSLPVQTAPFSSKTLFPFFENLVSEGWLCRTQAQVQHIDERDRFGLLLANGKDLIGAITIEEISDGNM